MTDVIEKACTVLLAVIDTNKITKIAIIFEVCRMSDDDTKWFLLMFECWQRLLLQQQQHR